MNKENHENAKWILKQLQSLKVEVKKIRVLDLCCGVFDDIGTVYDQNGLAYQPIVAQELARAGYKTFGLDFRENKTIQKILYTPISNLDFLEKDFNIELAAALKLKETENIFNVIVFLRSWDTPEILLKYQQEYKIPDLNVLSIEIAKELLPKIKTLLKVDGLFFTTDIFNYALVSEAEIENYKKLTIKLFKDYGLEIIIENQGLFCLKYTSQ